jgi:hypothetical protein
VVSSLTLTVRGHGALTDGDWANGRSAAYQRGWRDHQVLPKDSYARCPAYCQAYAAAVTARKVNAAVVIRASHTRAHSQRVCCQIPNSGPSPTSQACAPGDKADAHAGGAATWRASSTARRACWRRA